jgi:hypothetical protein
MKAARRLLLAWIVTGIVIGAYLRAGAAGEASRAPPRLNFLEHADLVEKTLGPFKVERKDADDRFAFWLRSPQCDEAILVNGDYVEHAPSEQTIAARFPAAAWRTLYVHDGHASQDFHRLSAYVRFVARRFAAQLTRAPLSVSELAFFTFHTPAHCVLDPGAAIAASQALIDFSGARSE